MPNLVNIRIIILKKKKIQQKAIEIYMLTKTDDKWINI